MIYKLIGSQYSWDSIFLLFNLSFFYNLFQLHFCLIRFCENLPTLPSMVLQSLALHNCYIQHYNVLPDSPSFLSTLKASDLAGQGKDYILMKVTWRCWNTVSWKSHWFSDVQTLDIRYRTNSFVCLTLSRDYKTSSAIANWLNLYSEPNGLFVIGVFFKPAKFIIA